MLQPAHKLQAATSKSPPEYVNGRKNKKTGVFWLAYQMLISFMNTENHNSMPEEVEQLLQLLDRGVAPVFSPNQTASLLLKIVDLPTRQRERVIQKIRDHLHHVQ